MAVLNDGSFVLDPQHIVRGLTTADFSAYAGFPVPVLHIDAFPHWEKLLDRETLSYAESNERALHIYQAFISDERIGGHTIIAPESFIDAATTVGEYICYEVSLAAWPADPSCHFWDIRKNGLDALNQRSLVAAYEEVGAKRFVVYPSPLVTSLSPKIGIMKSHGFAMLGPQSESLSDSWHRMVALPSDYVFDTHFQTPAIKLFIALHEMRHLTQASIPYDESFLYAQELDCDLFARHVLRKAGVGTETEMAMITGTRYIDIVNEVSSIDWTGIMLDALETGGAMHLYADVKRVGCEICHHLFEKSLGFSVGQDPQALRFSDEYKEWCEENLFDRPAKGYRLLAKMTENKVFARDALAQQMAEKIVAAVELFSPGLTKKPVARPRSAQILPNSF